MHFPEESVDEDVVGAVGPWHALRAEGGRGADMEECEGYCGVGGWEKGF